MKEALVWRMRNDQAIRPAPSAHDEGTLATLADGGLIVIAGQRQKRRTAGYVDFLFSDGAALDSGRPDLQLWRIVLFP